MSYRIFVRMIDLPEETFWQNTTLAGTYSERNKAQEYRSQDQKRRGVLNRRKIVHFQIFFGLFQECLDVSFQLLGTKSRIVLRIGTLRSW